MSLLVVGSMALDDIETPFGVRESLWGGSATYFSTAASYFTEVCVVAVVGEDFPEACLRFLSERGVDLSGLARIAGPTFRWKGKYDWDLADPQTLDTRLGVFADFRPTLSEAQRRSEYVFLANIDPDLQREVVEQVEGPRLVACDTMNFWIDGKRDALLRTLERVDLLVINDSEARQLSGEHNIVKAAEAIRAMGPARLIVKRGEYGAMLFDEGHVFYAPAFPLFDVVDPTGAGDSFAGGLMGYLAQAGDLARDTVRQAMVAGSVMASFAVQGFSLERMQTLGPREIAARMKDFRALTHFDDISPEVLRDFEPADPP